MNILKIRFKNINSLKGEHSVDFTQSPLSTAGLFAITGPTGSGKTTILDVITLALYCRIPRVSDTVTKGFIGKSGLILTRNMSDAFAEVTYSCKKGIFISLWSISTNRNGNLREHHMELAAESGELLPLRKSEVAAKNEALIGLNFDQFVKAILLAQGDFAAFLQAKGDERGRLLEKVTGTLIYRELGKAAFHKNRLHGQELEHLKAQESHRQGQLIDEGAYKALLEAIAWTDNQLRELTARIETVKGQEKIKLEIATLNRTVADHELKLAELEENLRDFLSEYGQPMEQHEKLLPYQKQLWEWSQQAKTLEREERELQDLQTRLQECDTEEAAIRKEVAQLTRSEAPVNEALKVFEARVLDLKGRLSEAASLSKNAGLSVTSDAKALAVPLSNSHPAKAATELAKIRDVQKQELSRLMEILDSQTLENPTETLCDLKDDAEKLGSLISVATILESQKNRLQKLGKEQEQLTREIEPLPALLEKTKAQQKQQELIFKGLEKDKKIRDLSASLEHHRQKLQDGHPCPLCGATQHPYSEEAPATDDLLESKIKEAYHANEALKKAINSLEANLTHKAGQLEKTTREWDDLKEEVKKDQDKADAILNGLPAAYRQNQPETTLQQVKERVARVEQYALLSEKENRLESLAAKVQQWNEYYESAVKINDELKSIFSGSDILAVTRKFQERITGNSTRMRKYAEQKESLENRFRENRDVHTALHQQLLRNLPAYSSPLQAMNDLLKDETYKALQVQKEEFSKEIERMLSALKVHRENRDVFLQKDVKETAAELAEKRKIAEEQQRSMAEERDGLVGKKNFQDKTLQELEGLQTQIALQKKQNEKWVLLNKYIGDAEGKRFSTFAQELTLEQLVLGASRRLKMLNERYLLAIPQEEEDDSLVVIDTHMGNLRRSVKSLSGGESFLVSLSLALALSDLAAHKVEIKSLFIDEGFGSLDKLTLDQTMDTLEKLQNETSKTIGVISHVEAMQERITTQVKLEKGGQGYSSLRVE